MARIDWVKRETRNGITESWTAQFSNGTRETYSDETLPPIVTRFCRLARYAYKDMYGEYLGELMVDWYSRKPMAPNERSVRR